MNLDGEQFKIQHELSAILVVTVTVHKMDPSIRVY